MSKPNILVGRCHFCFDFFLEENIQEVELKNLPKDSRGMVFMCTKCMLKLRKGMSLLTNKNGGK